MLQNGCFLLISAIYIIFSSTEYAAEGKKNITIQYPLRISILLLIRSDNI